MKVNYTYKVGDTVIGKDVYRFGASTWMHVYKKSV
jgi:hypothetical protein